MAQNITMISIVIPVYNAAPYVAQCVASLLEHVRGEREVILVDDGSTDGSGSVCDGLAAQHADVIAVHQSNAGVSAARNRGIELARGEWLWFVDADDSVCDDVDVESVMPSARFVAMGCVWNEEGRSLSCGADSSDVPYNTWRCLFRRSVAMEGNVRFVAGRRYAEDQEFILRYLLRGRVGVPSECAVLDYPVYCYTVRAGSAITAKGRKWVMLSDMLAVWLSVFACASVRLSLHKGWVLHALKRMAKTFWVTLIRVS